MQLVFKQLFIFSTLSIQILRVLVVSNKYTISDIPLNGYLIPGGQRVIEIQRVY